MKHLPSLLCLLLGLTLTWFAPSIPTLSGWNVAGLRSTANVPFGQHGGDAATPMFDVTGGNHLQVDADGHLVWAKTYQLESGGAAGPDVR